MDAAVPFTLLASVQVVAFAAALGLAATGAMAAYRRGARVLLAAGGLLLAASHSLAGAGADLGPEWPDLLTLLRAAGYLFVALGCSGLHVVDVAAVAPLGASASATALATATAAAAAVGSRWVRRPGRRLLLVAFVFAAAGEALGTLARDRSWAAVTELVLRGGWALATGAFVARVADTRLLSKVVAAILAGVLMLAVGLALIVGSVTTRALDRDTAATIEQVTTGQIDSIDSVAESALTTARVAAESCTPELKCEEVLSGFTPEPNPFAARVDAGGRVRPRYEGLTELEARSLAQSPVVREVLDRGRPAATKELLVGGGPVKLVVLGVAPAPHGPGEPVPFVFVFGSVIGQERVQRIKNETDFDATIFIGDTPAVSSLEPGARADLVAEFARRRVLDRFGGGTDAVTVPAEGDRPAVRYEVLRNSKNEFLGALALSADSNVVLRTQESVLRALFVGTLLVALLVGVLAVLLGRRIVRPVQQLTVAAGRVRRGDLSVRTQVESVDELGVLSRTFDAMTSSLAASTQELLRAAEEEAALRGRLQAVVNSMGDGLITTDAADVVTAVNPATATMLGRTEDELLGRPVTDVLVGRDPAGAPLLSRLEETPGVRTGSVVTGSGRVVSVALALTALRGQEGHVIVVRDTTREREVERMKTEFLSNVSHELRTPLTPIRGYAEILCRRPDLSADKTAEYAGSILESSVRMARVVDLLVDVAALEAGRVVPAVAPVAVGAFVDARLEAWRRREPGRELRRRIASGLPPVLIDQVWVGKAFDELVDNAVKYSTGPVTFAASAVADGRRVRLTVRDAGRGISEEDRATLFTPFEQLDGSSTRAVGGLGLGLSFVRRVADDFGLDVVVESTLGKGSAFSLDVPVAPARAAGGRRP